MDASARNIGIALKKRKDPISFDQFVNYRFGKFSEDEHITSIAEFSVQKITIRVNVSEMICSTFSGQSTFCIVIFVLGHIFCCYFQIPVYQEPVRRTLCLSESCIIERDPATYNMVTLKPLSEVKHFHTVQTSLMKLANKKIKKMPFPFVFRYFLLYEILPTLRNLQSSIAKDKEESICLQIEIHFLQLSSMVSEHLVTEMFVLR